MKEFRVLAQPAELIGKRRLGRAPRVETGDFGLGEYPGTCGGRPESRQQSRSSLERRYPCNRHLLSWQSTH